MATYTKFNVFVQDLAHKVHNLDSDTLELCLTNSAPVATNTVLANLTPIDYTYCSARTLVKTSSGHTSGTYKLVLEDKVLTASGGTVGPFRYIVVFNQTATNDPLIAFYDYGATGVTLQAGETFTVDFDGTNGFLQLA